ncbi:DMT family transporter [Pseudonocardia endophytica]|uniref:EamA-like transporter family protein n=1 Tax=Pseudonocardia endophytica TaxID=401976 RepID=A0A4V2PHU1_PSEEN|nr:DMT family transporter [Pseudonocardia endophytica]TCK22066.1 EamA-like transporter family protein [Pseudonocardia endophytica]
MTAALGAVVLWSTNAYAAGYALERMSVGWLLLVQFGTAAVVFGVLRVRARTAQAAPGRRGPGVVAVGLVGLTGTIVLQYVAFALAPIVAANVLAYGWPLLAAVWVAATRRDAPSLAGAGLAVLGFAGVALIFAGPGHDAGVVGDDAVAGYAAALGSALCMTFYTLGSARSAIRPADLLAPATTVGAVVAGTVVAVTGPPAPGPVGLAAAVYIGLGPMAAGYGLWTRAMSGGGAARLAPLGFATPMLSTGLLLVAGATAAVSTLAGIGLVLVCSLGVLVVHRYAGRAVVPPTADRPSPRRPDRAAGRVLACPPRRPPRRPGWSR